MNFENIFKKQKDLDEAMSTKSALINPNLTSFDYSQQKLLALIVETAELANEIQSFKYWKKNKIINKNSALEEYADLIHFLVSFANNFNLDPKIDPLVVSNDFNEQLTQLFISIAHAMVDINHDSILKIFKLTLGVAKIMGFTNKEIEFWYNFKNKKNYDRITNNY